VSIVNLVLALGGSGVCIKKLRLPLLTNAKNLVVEKHTGLAKLLKCALVEQQKMQPSITNVSVNKLY
jgi:hypothetical protein